MNFRFAPSPTGSLHVGSVRTMLINYILAKQLGLLLILRIDEGNLAINHSQHLSNIFFNLGLLNITVDKIELQSKYINLAKKRAQMFIEQNQAYYCQCAEIASCACEQQQYQEGRTILKVDRFKDKLRTHQDIVFGSIHNSELYNIVLTKSDGVPLYNYITAIADLESGITFVIRGADHIYNTWKQIAIFLALNEEHKIPKYGHIPLLLDEQKRKLSKRSKNYISIVDMLKNGISVCAIVNYLLSLNCNFTQELFDIEYALANLDINKITKQNIIFTLHKLNSINKRYIENNVNITHDIFLCALMNDIKLDRYIELRPIINRFKNIKEILDFIVLLGTTHNIVLTTEERVCLEAYNGNIISMPAALLRKIIIGKPNGPSERDLIQILGQIQINKKISLMKQTLH